MTLSRGLSGSVPVSRGPSTLTAMPFSVMTAKGPVNARRPRRIPDEYRVTADRVPAIANVKT